VAVQPCQDHASHARHSPIVAAQARVGAWAQADAGGGWLEYNIINPLIGDVRRKASFVLPPSADWLIGRSAYRSALKSS